MLSALLCLCSTVLFCSAATHASVLTPNVLPLTVRNPYFQTWLTNAREAPWTRWPIFWNGQPVGMGIMAIVNETKTVYSLLGRLQDSLSDHSNHYSLSLPRYLGASYDASTTNFTYHIPGPSSNQEPAELVISFISPITPTSTLRQSIAASYILFSVTAGFNIDIYMDVNGGWLSGDRNVPIKWYMESIEDEHTDSLRSWSIERELDLLFTENTNQAEWGKLRFTARMDTNFACGSSKDVRTLFAKTGSLDNQCSSDFRRISDREPVFAFHKAFHLGDEDDEIKHASTYFTLAHLQDPVTQFASARGLTLMRPLWKSWFTTEYALTVFHYFDFPNTMELASNYSAQLASDAYRHGGEDYVDIVALSARQVLGATSFAGTPDNPLLFLKEISSNGNTQTVDVIFPSWPFFAYTNPRWLAYLLEPLLEHQLSGQYPNKYSMHDLGAHFPNLTGHADGRDEYMPVEECGDMLIMGLSLVKSLQYKTAEAATSIWSTLGHYIEGSLPKEYPIPVALDSRKGQSIWGLDDRFGGGSRGEEIARRWLKRSWRIWKQWTEYLIDESLIPANQLCTDDFAGWLPYQTNLALKGIIGINAMAELSRTLHIERDYKYYKNISETYIKKWQDYALSIDGGHAKLSYNWYGSWTTLYSLFADSMLCFHQQPSDHLRPFESTQNNLMKKTLEISKQAIQQPWIAAKRVVDHDLSPLRKHNHTKNFIPHEIYTNQSRFYMNVLQKYGLPLDSRHLYTKSDWMIQVAAISTPELKHELISRHARWVNETVTNLPMSDLWVAEYDGGFGAGNRFTSRPVVGSHFALVALERACLSS